MGVGVQQQLVSCSHLPVCSYASLHRFLITDSVFSCASVSGLLYHKSFMDEVKLTGMSGREVNVAKDLENWSIHVAFAGEASGSVRKPAVEAVPEL